MFHLIFKTALLYLFFIIKNFWRRNISFCRKKSNIIEPKKRGQFLYKKEKICRLEKFFSQTTDIFY
ncbi:hypothetical protein C0966_13180 [Bacillus methanolicus]|nr:hypothetical protein [Bacillus methanolicus]